MKLIHLRFIFLVLLFALNSRAFSQNNVLADGEELFYEVYYSFVNIGWLKFNTERVSGKVDTYRCFAVMRSNEGLPFIDVSYDFESEMTVRNNSIYPNKFVSKEYRDEKVSIISYDFHYDSNYVYIKKTGFNNNTEYERKQVLNANYQDGLSILYYARYHSFTSAKKNVPALVNQDSMGLTINFNTEKEEIDIGEVDYDMASVYLSGYTNYQMVFGLTGEFEGWFSYDNARVPLKSKLEVKIGRVTVELKYWKRQGWTPPKY
jgi:hypothetical protein